MAIANYHEKLLFFTRQKSFLTNRLSDIQMQQLSATRISLQKQQEYNAQLSALYYDPDFGYGTEEYSQMLLQLNNEHEFELSTINAWESELELEKENLENQLNEITQYESSWQKLLQNNIKKDFAYGGGGK